VSVCVRAREWVARGGIHEGGRTAQGFANKGARHAYTPPTPPTHTPTQRTAAAAASLVLDNPTQPTRTPRQDLAAAWPAPVLSGRWSRTQHRARPGTTTRPSRHQSGRPLAHQAATPGSCWSCQRRQPHPDRALGARYGSFPAVHQNTGKKGPPCTRSKHQEEKNTKHNSPASPVHAMADAVCTFCGKHCTRQSLTK
jgi:hypothetical protein